MEVQTRKLLTLSSPATHQCPTDIARLIMLDMIIREAGIHVRTYRLCSLLKLESVNREMLNNHYI